MNFSHSCFYKLDGDASDALGNAPTGTVGGTTDGIWANAGSLTINNAQGSAGDNYIALISDYIHEMCDLSTMDGQSLVVMFWFRQPTVVASGSPMLLSYGRLTTASNPDGAWAIGGEGSLSMWYSYPDSASYYSRAAVMISPLVAAQNDTWIALTLQIDVFNGKCTVSSCINGRPQQGARMFDWDDYGLPKTDSIGAVGLRLLSSVSSGGTPNNFMWGQTQIKRLFIGRTNGEQRHNIPKWANQFYSDPSGINDFMVV